MYTLSINSCKTKMWNCWNMEFRIMNFMMITSIFLIAAVRENGSCLISPKTFGDPCIKTIVCHTSMQMTETFQEYIQMCQEGWYNRYGNHYLDDRLQIRVELHNVMEFQAYDLLFINGDSSIRDNVRSLNSSGNMWSDLSWPLLGDTYKKINVLNVSHNYITSIDTSDVVNFMRNLTTLDLSYNKIRFINYTGVNLQAPFILPEYDQYPQYDDISDQQSNFKRNSPLKTLILSHNHLEKIGEKVLADFVFLRKLDVSYNNIQSKKMDFYGLDNLVELNLSHNNISSLERSLAIFTKLWILDVSFNQIVNISEQNFQHLLSLRVLNLTHNCIKYIDSNILTNMIYLQKIDLSENLLVGDIGSLFTYNTRLRVVNVRNNAISVLRKNTFINHNLTSIDIGGNHIAGKIEKDTFTGFPDMTEIDLSGQSFTEIGSSAFKGSPSMVTLNLSSNSISSVDVSSFRGLINLKYLDLSKNYLVNIQFETNDLVDLIWLSLESNSLTQLQVNAFHGLNSLRHLDISNNVISQISANSLFLESLTYLRLFNNSLSGTLQDKAFRGLTNLPKLDISYSQLTSIGNETFVDLKRLLELNISYNSLSNIEYNAFVNLYELDTLDLSYNTLTSFHVNISSIYNLQTLNLNNNNLIKIREFDFMNFTSLRTLIISNNIIIEIENNSLRSLERLTNFNVKNNSLTYIPRDMFSYHHMLSSVDISNNQLQEKSLNFWNIHIQSVYLKDNQITEISKLNFPAINSFQLLDVSYNRITKISSQSLRHLRYLWSLDVSGNQITDIAPGCFTNLSSIVFLNASHNHLTSVSFGTFNGLSHLEVLDLSHNNIFDINANKFYDLKKLKYLIIDHNNIVSFNIRSLLNLINVSKISMGGNPLDCNWLTEIHRLVDDQVLVVSIEALTLTHDTQNVRKISCTHEGPSDVAASSENWSNNSTHPKEMFQYFDLLSKVIKSGMDAVTRNLSETQRLIVKELNDLNHSEKNVIAIFNDFANNVTSNKQIVAQQNEDSSLAVNKSIEEQNNTFFSTLTALQNVIKTMYESRLKEDNNTFLARNETKEVPNDNVKTETLKLIDMTKNIHSTIIDFYQKVETSKAEMKDIRDKLIKELKEISSNKERKKPEGNISSIIAASTSNKNGAVSLALTESCVIIMLIIMCAFIVYKVYQSYHWRYTLSSQSTQRISNEIEI